ncbi:MAG: hypothetical protein EAX87_10005 [Candidatus Thorarchaeota archaeon]|nr:hypothetical protein [Candidatus Thorarchaeota archaeon]
MNSNRERRKGRNFVVIGAILIFCGMTFYLPSLSPLELLFFPLVAVVGSIILIYGLFLIFNAKNMEGG